MKPDTIKQFLQIQEALRKEKADLEARLKQINQVLEGAPSKMAAKLVPAGARSKGKRLKNPISLRQAIINATSVNPLTKSEILAAVKKQGYRFGTANPVGSLNAILYAKKKFKNQNGKFSPAK